ncbi:hypothetical protein FLAV_00877 [Flavobacteriales bacterium]|nr:hypothetical protein FLAV_00877 [Flavobacteriales bacterium]
MNSLLENIAFSKTASGMEIILHAKEQVSFNYCTIRYKKEKVDITGYSKNIFSSDVLSVLKEKKNPLIVSIDGHGILHKKLRISLDSPVGYLTETAFPGSNPDEFYVQITPASEHECWVSLIRKELADKIIQSLLDAGWLLHTFYLGPFSLSAAMPFIANNEPIITNTAKQVSIRNNLVFEIQRTDALPSENPIIPNEPLPASFLVSFASALSYFTGLHGVQTISSPLVVNAAKELHYRNIFHKTGVVALAACMLLTFSNMFLFTKLNSQNNELTLLVSNHSKKLLQIESLEQQLNLKKALVEKSGLKGRGKAAFYTDRIAASLPEQITLTGIAVNPIVKKSKEDEIPEFSYRTLLIKGQVSQSLFFNDWLHLLKKMNWINDVSILDYKQQTGLPAEFEILLQI